MSHRLKHLSLILRHRHRVIKNATHMGIFFHALKHDLTKFSHIEFVTSAKFYIGNHSPVYEERLSNNYFSSVCQHHTKRNPHHWEYWADFFAGRILAKAMPWVYACEYVCDVISASYTYNPKAFKTNSPYEYFENKKSHYFMNDGTKEFISWCLKQFSETKWANLKKKQTKAKYKEIMAKYSNVQIYSTELSALVTLPHLNK